MPVRSIVVTETSRTSVGGVLCCTRKSCLGICFSIRQAVAPSSKMLTSTLLRSANGRALIFSCVVALSAVGRAGMVSDSTTKLRETTPGGNVSKLPFDLLISNSFWHALTVSPRIVKVRNLRHTAMANKMREGYFFIKRCLRVYQFTLNSNSHLLSPGYFIGLNCFNKNICLKRAALTWKKTLGWSIAPLGDDTWL